ncbi:hypothetical protein CDAR_177121 [Caerostris darwini]|uniref:Transformer n=1 Tax=Caerostris darwini TaxID=1538125 RepID=A0AAV4N2T7_9ARAC|nr:hypothetical protein CDAR_177121 [Caerostris darwini]
MDVEDHQRIRPTTHRDEKRSRRRMKGAVTQNSAPPDKGMDRVASLYTGGHPRIRKMDVEEHQKIRPTTHREEKKSRRGMKGAVTPPHQIREWPQLNPYVPRGEREPRRIINRTHQ